MSAELFSRMQAGGINQTVESVEIGRPASQHAPRVHRYVPAAIAVYNQSEDVMNLIRSGEMAAPEKILTSIAAAQMPRRGGIITLSGKRALGSYDLQAATLRSDEIRLSPALKSAVDPETKEVRERGIVTFTRFNVGKDLNWVQIASTQPIAEAFNPDEEVWKAAYYSQWQRLKQNEHGIVIASLDVLANAYLARRPLSCDPQAGSTTIHL